MLRGNGGQIIFTDDADRVRMCLMLQKASEEYLFKIHAFCFMSNHIHLVLEPTTIPLSQGVHAFAGRYAQYFNRRHNRKGHLFQDRYRSIITEDGTYLMRLTRYIHLNPVRASIISDPLDYPWSSYRVYMGQTEITWISQQRVLKRFVASGLTSLQFMAKYTAQKNDADKDIIDIHESNIVGAYGSQEFVTTSTTETTDSANANKAPFSLQEIINKACQFYQIQASDLASSKKGQPLTDIRSSLILAISKIPGLSLKELGINLDRDLSSIYRSIQKANASSELSLKADEFLQTLKK